MHTVAWCGLESIFIGFQRAIAFVFYRQELYLGYVFTTEGLQL